MDCNAIIAQIDQQALDALVKSINIPARPSLLQDLQNELGKVEPDLKVVAQVASRDVALSAAVLRAANSAMYSLPRKVETMDQAVGFLGLRNIGALLLGVIARNAIQADGPMMPRFWDESTKRALALQYLSKTLRNVEQDVAQTFGLFCDLGVPLLYQRFPGYTQTLEAAASSTERSFTEVERDAHHTDHATVGALMARTWGLSQHLCLAIRLHHDYTAIGESSCPDEVRQLMAMGLVAEYAIRRYEGLSESVEWNKGGALAMEELGISPDSLVVLLDDLFDKFNSL